MFYFDQIEGKQILKSDYIKNANAFFTTRNFCLKSDDLLTADKNKSKLCNYLAIERQNLISPIQTHSINIATVKEGQIDYPETDGLILTDKKHAIFLNFADCTPIILYDKVQNIGAICHAGWRGTAGKIANLTVNKLVSEFNSNACDITALIGPTIGICCYEVGNEVYEKLSATVSDFRGLYKKINGKIFVDLKMINKKQLLESGVKEIDVCPYCTFCDNEYFFSYRKENATPNRHSAVLKLI